MVALTVQKFCNCVIENHINQLHPQLIVSTLFEIFFIDIILNLNMLEFLLSTY